MGRRGERERCQEPEGDRAAPAELAREQTGREDQRMGGGARGQGAPRGLVVRRGGKRRTGRGT